MASFFCKWDFFFFHRYFAGKDKKTPLVMRRGGQLADKGMSTVETVKRFRPPFSKGGAVEAAEASSPSAEGEIPLLALLFCELFSCAYIVKRKAANHFVRFLEPLFRLRIHGVYFGK